MTLRDSPGSFWHKNQQTYIRTADVIMLTFYEVKQLTDDVIILKLIVMSSYGEVSGPCALPNRVDTPNSPNFGL